MSSGNWEKFWNKRKGGLTIKQHEPFYKNFCVMANILGNCKIYPTYGDNGQMRSTLEVGAGRGTISDLFFQKGFDTYCTDIYKKIRCPDRHKYTENDILKCQPFVDNSFDIVFTYGLLEHFDRGDRLRIINRCLKMTRGGGACIHYVVPKKLTNIFEDRSVPRYKCSELEELYGLLPVSPYLRMSGVRHVFPFINRYDWECPPWASKGFFVWMKKYTKTELEFNKSVMWHEIMKQNPILERMK